MADFTSRKKADVEAAQIDIRVTRGIGVGQAPNSRLKMTMSSLSGSVSSANADETDSVKGASVEPVCANRDGVDAERPVKLDVGDDSPRVIDSIDGWHRACVSTARMTRSHQKKLKITFLAFFAFACSQDTGVRLISVEQAVDFEGDDVVQVRLLATGEDGSGYVCATILWLNGTQEVHSGLISELNEPACHYREECDDVALSCFSSAEEEDGLLCYRNIETVASVTECISDGVAQGEEFEIELWRAPIDAEHTVVLSPGANGGATVL